MVLKYEEQIINVNNLENLEITIIITKKISCDTQEIHMLIDKNSINGHISISFDDLNLAEKLIEDIKEKYKNDTEFYNIGTKLKQLAEDNNNED